MDKYWLTSELAPVTFGSRMGTAHGAGRSAMGRVWGIRAAAAMQRFWHWRQTQPLLRSNRAGVRWLSQDLCPRREESPGQSKVGAIAAKTSLDQLFVQYMCTVTDEINGNYLQLP